MSTHRFTSSPRFLRSHGVQLDNLALVPASLLPFKAQWQAIANSHPKGTVLIILPIQHSPKRDVFEKVVAMLEADGHQVTTLPAEQFAHPVAECPGFR